MKKAFMLLLAVATVVTTYAADKVMWLRSNMISPDGSEIAFVYHGDIFVVSSHGGKARQITGGIGYNTRPVWSPDGKLIAFSSDRFGGFDVFVTSAQGGSPKRLTTHSANEMADAFLPDGRILYTALYSTLPNDNAMPMIFPYTYSVDTAASRPKLFAPITMFNISVNSKGEVLYHDYKGYENNYRKHHTSSVTRDIWLTSTDAKHRNYRKLSDYIGENRNPCWAPDGKSYYYLEESSGSFNVYRRNIDGSGKRQLTHFKGNPVRYLSVANNGLMSFSYDGSLYTMREGEEPQRLNIQIVTDNTKPDIVNLTLKDGASSVSVSKDEKQVAFIAHGDVFVTSADYETTKRITATPEEEKNVSISPDGKTLVYDSERGGAWGIYKATMPNKDDDSFVYATEIKEEPLITTGGHNYQPEFSPDGKKIAYWANRTELRVYDVASKTSRTVLPGNTIAAYNDFAFGYAWSPNSKYLLSDYAGENGYFNNDVALAYADGSKFVNLTESGYSDTEARFSPDGRAMLFSSDRDGYRSHGSWGSQQNVYIMFLDNESYEKFKMSKEDRELYKKAQDKAKAEKDKKDKDKKEKADKSGKDSKKDKKSSSKKSSKKDNKKDSKKKDGDKAKNDTTANDSVKDKPFELDGREFRVERLTSISSSLGDFCLSPDGRKLYYGARIGASTDLHVKNLDDGSDKVLVGGLGFGSVTLSADGKHAYTPSRGIIKKVTLDNGSVKNIDFSAECDYSRKAQNEYIYNHVTNSMKEKFYRADMNGIDWDGYVKSYRRFLADIDNDYDFSEMMSELLGELNASHTGAICGFSSAPKQVAELGAFYDLDYDGDGLKIKEIVSQGPLEFVDSKVKAGDIITKINGKPILKGKDYFPLLAGLAGKRTLLTIADSKGKNEYTISIKPITSGQMSGLLNNRWIKKREELTDKYSNGKVGYVHVPQMNSSSFRDLYSKVLGKYRNRESLVVDIRYNGGGWLHNDLCDFLSGKVVTRIEPRGKQVSVEPFNRWCKPSVVVTNECDYSDASGFPFMYQSLGIGKLVGAAVPATMTAVVWERQINGTITVGYPILGNKDLNGEYLENRPIKPDIEVIPTPEQRFSDDDLQLKRAVESLMGK